MFIQNYQIHNVLNVYRKQLSQRISGQSKQTGGSANGTTKKTISEEGKNQSIMDKVAANVLKKITTINSDAAESPKEVKPVNEEKNKRNRYGEENRFTFNTIVDSNQKETRSISLNDSQGLMVQLNHLARAAIGYKTDGNKQST